eukprot:686736-Pleurochrysis_carterae.AAC.1
MSLGRLAMESHVALHVQASTGYSSLTLPSGNTIPLLNVGVLVIPKRLQQVTSLVTQGNREQASGAHMIAE